MNICFMQRTMHFSWSKFYGDGDPKVPENRVYNGSVSYLHFPDNHNFYIFECIFCFMTNRTVYYHKTDSISKLLVEFSEFYNNSAKDYGVNIYYKSTGDIINTRICVHNCEQFKPEEEYYVEGLHAYSLLSSEEVDSYDNSDYEGVTEHKNYFIDMSISLSNSMEACGVGSISCAYGELQISKYNCTFIHCQRSPLAYCLRAKNNTNISFTICKNTSCDFNCFESRAFDEFAVTLKYCRFESNKFNSYFLGMFYSKSYIEKSIFVNNTADDVHASFLYGYAKISECYIDEKLRAPDCNNCEILSPIHELANNLYRFHINACSPDPILPTVIHDDDIHILLILIEKIFFIIQ